MNLLNALERVAENAITKQNADGSLPSGKNGPHADPETPVRNTCHYLILFSRLYESTGNERYRDAAQRAAAYLTTKKARPHGQNYHHRESEADKCNCLVGPAWTIEAIAESGRILDIPNLIDIAEEIFLLHPFDEQLGIWKRVEIDGKVICFDSTYNHQQWFAAAGGLLAKYHNVDPEIDRQVRKFLERSSSILGQRASGIFEMLVLPPVRYYPYVALKDNNARMLQVLLASNSLPLEYESVRNFLLSYTPLTRLPLTKTDYYYRMVGYQSFHLHGFALLKEAYPNHEFWELDFINKGLNHIRNEQFIRRLQNNRYGYPYNISGVELAYALDVFEENSHEEQREWLARQFDNCWDEERGMMARHNSDPETLTARLYEASRLSNLEIEFQSGKVSGISE